MPGAALVSQLVRTQMGGYCVQDTSMMPSHDYPP